MLHQKPTRWDPLFRHRSVRLLADLAAGIHAGNGLAHGVPPSRRATVRRGDVRPAK